MINRVESKPFRLHPGVILNDKLVTECVVTILTRGEKKALEKEPEVSREDTALAWSILRLGDITDRTLILSALNDLADVDVSRIKAKSVELENQYYEAGEAEEPAIRRILSATDIAGEPFALNPGIIVDGKKQKSCIVRLMTRGESKRVQREETLEAQNDLFFLFIVAQIGDIVNVKQEHIDLLTEVDIERINEAYEELRAQYAPDAKSGK
jgi:hypothetical protein